MQLEWEGTSEWIDPLDAEAQWYTFGVDVQDMLLGITLSTSNFEASCVLDTHDFEGASTLETGDTTLTSAFPMLE